MPPRHDAGDLSSFGAQTKSPLQECGPDYSLQMVWIRAHYIHVYFTGSQHVFHSEWPRRTSVGGGRKSLRIKVFSDLLVTVICLSHAFKSAAFNVQLRVSHGRKDRVMETGGCFYTSFGGPAALLPRKLTQRCLARYSPELVEASAGSLFLPWNNLFFSHPVLGWIQMSHEWPLRNTLNISNAHQCWEECITTLMPRQSCITFWCRAAI